MLGGCRVPESRHSIERGSIGRDELRFSPAAPLARDATCRCNTGGAFVSMLRARSLMEHHDVKPGALRSTWNARSPCLAARQLKGATMPRCAGEMVGPVSCSVSSSRRTKAGRGALRMSRIRLLLRLIVASVQRTTAAPHNHYEHAHAGDSAGDRSTRKSLHVKASPA